MNEGFFRYFFCWPRPGPARGVPLIYSRQPRDIAPVLIVAVAAVIGLVNFQVLHLIELWVVDMQFALTQAHAACDIYIVRITDDDYAGIGARSPLPVEFVKRLLVDAASLGPKVIGVDLDTADQSWDKACTPAAATCVSLPATVRPDPASSGASASVPEVIWAAIPEPAKSGEAFSWENTLPIVSPPLGNTLRNWRSNQQDWTSIAGLPGFPQDPDGKVRHYVSNTRFTVRVRMGPDRVKEDPAILSSFARKIVDRFNSGVKKADQPKADQPYLEFGRVNFPTITAGELVKCAKTSQPGCKFKIRGQDFDKSPNGKILLIGGQFHAARDAYETPNGSITGVELNGMAIDSALWHPPLDEPEWYKRLLFDLGLGTLLTLSYWSFERCGKHTVGVFFGTVVFSLVALVFSYCWFHFFAFAVPVLFGINLHQYVEHLRMAARK